MKPPPLIFGKFLLKKFEGKGGWTYITVPRPAKLKSRSFRWFKIKGSIDGFELKQYKLMPMKDGDLFFPVKAAIRKQIGKEAGDRVELVLYEDASTLRIPKYILSCFDYEDPRIGKTFFAFTESEQKHYVDWIIGATQAATRERRILKMMERLSDGRRMYEADQV